uniref:Retrotrans_gag domain-containing protein n=1 Tax=Panagrellus redivivus TaxID=6233 RepID=A0A7E4VYF7_PANRE
MVRLTITATVDIDPDSFQQLGTLNKTSTAPQKAGAVLQNPVPKQKRAYKRTIVKTFGNYQRFCALLKALESCGPQLSKMKAPEEMQYLVNCPSLRPFKLQLLDENFCENWMTLYDKCQKLKSPRNWSMKTVADGIRDGLAKTGSLIQWFGDFPALPNGQREDFVRFRDELKILQRNGKLRYNAPQRNYINQRLSKIEADIAEFGKDGEVGTTESSLIHTQPSATSVSTRDGVTIRSHVDTHESAVKRANIVLSSAPPSVQALSKDGSPTAFDVFLKANPEMSKTEARKAFSYLDTPTRSLFTNLAKAFH